MFGANAWDHFVWLGGLQLEILAQQNSCAPYNLHGSSFVVRLLSTQCPVSVLISFWKARLVPLNAIRRTAWYLRKVRFRTSNLRRWSDLQNRAKAIFRNVQKRYHFRNDWIKRDNLVRASCRALDSEMSLDRPSEENFVRPSQEPCRKEEQDSDRLKTRRLLFELRGFQKARRIRERFPISRHCFIGSRI